MIEPEYVILSEDNSRSSFQDDWTFDFAAIHETDSAILKKIQNFNFK
jgi:hypothetical protein